MFSVLNPESLRNFIHSFFEITFASSELNILSVVAGLDFILRIEMNKEFHVLYYD